MGKIDYSFYGSGNMQAQDLMQSINQGIGIGQKIRGSINEAKSREAAEAGNAQADEAFKAYMAEPKNKENMMNLYKADSKLATGLFGIVSAGDKAQAAQIKEQADHAQRSYSNIYAVLQQGDTGAAKRMALDLREDFQDRGFDTKPLEDIATAQSSEQAMSIAQSKRALAGATLKVLDPLTADQAADNLRADQELGLKAQDQEFSQGLDAAKFGETKRSNRAGEAVASGNLSIKQQQADSATAPIAKRKSATDQNGVLRFVDSGEKVFPAVEKADVKGQREQRKNLNAYKTFEKAINNVDSAMGELMQTGVISGRLPAITAKAQTADGAIATLAPILKQIFRSSGEGNFTDKDQELLMAMVPTRKDEPEARKAKIKNIKDIVKSKMGLIDDSVNNEMSDEDLLNKYK